MTHKKNVALIAGATGQIGRAVSDHFHTKPGWDLIGLSRKPVTGGLHPFVAVDLLDAADCRARLGKLDQVTHLIYAARHDHAGGKQESAEINATMLANLLQALEPAAPGLRHVHLVHGTKYYGHMKGPRPVPYREDADRLPVELFYYDQQDYIAARQVGRPWTWSISRPHSFCDIKPDEPRSITLLVAVYATLLREMGLPLSFPAASSHYTVRTQATWLPALGRSIEWMMTTPACANQAYNITNGDVYTWDRLWSLVARYFDMPVGEPSGVGFSDFSADKGPLWQRITRKYGLRDTDLEQAMQWAYGDYALIPQWDVISDMSKARRDGFTEEIDSMKMWTDSFDYYRQQKLIP